MIKQGDSVRELEVTSSTKRPCAVALKLSSLAPLTTEQLSSIFLAASTRLKSEISPQLPQVLPIEGKIFLFDLGPDSSKWETIKRQLRLVQ